MLKKIFLSSVLLTTSLSGYGLSLQSLVGATCSDRNGCIPLYFQTANSTFTSSTHYVCLDYIDIFAYNNSSCTGVSPNAQLCVDSAGVQTSTCSSSSPIETGRILANTSTEIFSNKVQISATGLAAILATGSATSAQCVKLIAYARTATDVACTTPTSINNFSQAPLPAISCSNTGCTIVTGQKVDFDLES